MSVATVNRAGAVLARAVAGHPVEALALLEDRDPAPGPRQAGAPPLHARRTCSPSSRAPACARAVARRLRRRRPARGHLRRRAGRRPRPRAGAGRAVALPRHRHRPARPRHPPVTPPCRRTWRCRPTARPPSPTCCPARPPPSASRSSAATCRPIRSTSPPPSAAPAGSLVLLVDGLGADLIRAHADLAPTLAAPGHARRRPRPRRAPAPPRSASPPSAPACRRAATASSASSPTCPGEDRTLNHVQWADDPDPDAWQARPHGLRAGRRRRRRRRPPSARTPTPAPA